MASSWNPALRPDSEPASPMPKKSKDEPQAVPVPRSEYTSSELREDIQAETTSSADSDPFFRSPDQSQGREDVVGTDQKTPTSEHANLLAVQNEAPYEGSIIENETSGTKSLIKQDTPGPLVSEDDACWQENESGLHGPANHGASFEATSNDTSSVFQGIVGDTEPTGESPWRTSQIEQQWPNDVAEDDDFPEIAPLPSISAATSSKIAHSQAEAIIEEIETTDGFFDGSLPMGGSLPADTPLAQGDLRPDLARETDFSSITETESYRQIASEPEFARFEEGVPLMPQASSKSPEPISDDAFAFDDGDDHSFDETCFFDEASNPGNQYVYPSSTLRRKSTTQVYRSLHLTSDQDPSSSAFSRDSIPSPEVSNAQYSQSQKQEIQPTAMTEAADNVGVDSDLSDLWKAALADDAFMDDEDSHISPSDVSANDGGDFFAGTPNGAYDTSFVQGTSSPVRASVANTPQIVPNGGQAKRQATKSGAYFPSSEFRVNPNAQSSFPQASSNFDKYRSAAANTQQQYVGNSPAMHSFPGDARPQLTTSSQSFVDRSKAGYVSPYDLPEDVARPKKRAPAQFAASANNHVLADGRPTPPRRDSMQSSQRAAPLGQTADLGAPSTFKEQGKPAPPLKSSSSSFFEDLPLAKARPSSSASRTSAFPAQPKPPTLRSQTNPPAPMNDSAPPWYAASLDTGYQLAPRQNIGLYQDLPTQPPSRPAAQASSARYSPAPPAGFNASVPPTTQRYAASPAVAPRPPSSQANYQPRTSSPLTLRSLKTTTEQEPTHNYANANGSRGAQFRESAQPSTTGPPITESPPPMRPPPVGSVGRSQTTPYDLRTSESGPAVPILPATSLAEEALPQRSQTQSPAHIASTSFTPESVPIYQRSASVHNYAPQQTSNQVHNPSIHRHDNRQGLAQNEFIQPEDGRQLDELERWKGCPIFSFGFGGKIVKMFPQHVPRYASGQRQPLIKSSPGEVKLMDHSNTPLHESIKSFPGPLKSKSKKKEVLDWLNSKIYNMEHSAPTAMLEERILLWRVVKVFVEHDGVIEGVPAVDTAIRNVLSPEATSDPGVDFNHAPDNQSLGITKRDTLLPSPVSASSDSLEVLRNFLLRGEREKAVWHAVDSRLWAHAMLISSTMNQELGKQVAQEFVRQEVKSSGGNTEALAALYQVLAGNRQESIDELVPPSARAGLQMVSKSAGSGPARNALDGLDKWRETLTLILSNRSPDDYEAIVALGRLLASYSRTEAAHICYMCAKTPGLFGGPDDPQVSVSLLGADHTRQPFDYGRDLDSILLTEVYEFASTVLSTSSLSTISPHLQAHRLYHAMVLAEHGFKTESQQYCDAIAAVMKSTTKTSSYYHALLVGNLQTLQVRLKQIPQDSSGSWISKPNIDKVSGSIWAKFNSYVAGDEDGSAAMPSGSLNDPSAGPFAGVTGEQSTLSRTTSSSDLNGFGFSTALRASNAPNVASGGPYAPRVSLEAMRPSNTEMLRPANTPLSYSSRPSSSAGLRTPSYTPNVASYAPRSAYSSTASSSHAGGTSSMITQLEGEQGSYHPIATPPSLLSYDSAPYSQAGVSNAFKPSHDESVVSAAPSAPVIAMNEAGQEDWTNEPYPQHGLTNNTSVEHEQPTTDYQPSNSYEPPSFTYEPPSQVYSPTNNDESTEIRPKKSVMDLDDEDDFEARAAALRKEERARKDREADDAFKKAAEADAQKDKNPKLNSKKSWFGGGWFSSGKEKSNEAGGLNAPIKVKLGEESSFYFDKELGKWVNKKGGSEDIAPSGPIAPPKGPPSRTVSAAAGPPPRQDATPPVPPLPVNMTSGINGGPLRTVSGPSFPNTPSSLQQSRTASPALNAAATADHPAVSSGPPSAPPSRPATAQSGANDLDDLYGVGQTRKGGTVKRGKKGRGYVDVMAK